MIADPQSELVRHFLIEPTSKGVRLKGCSNEPVFGEFIHYNHNYGCSNKIIVSVVIIVVIIIAILIL